MAVPDFVNQLESTYVDIRRCSGSDIEQIQWYFFYRWMMITNETVFILASCLGSVSCLLKVLIQSC